MASLNLTHFQYIVAQTYTWELLLPTYSVQTTLVEAVTENGKTGWIVINW